MTEQDEERVGREIGVCYVCGKTFGSQIALTQHLTDVDEDNVLRPEGPEEQVPGSDSAELNGNTVAKTLETLNATAANDQSRNFVDEREAECPPLIP
jgi:hypothetical protein